MRDGTLVRLKDVGHAELGAESYSSDLQFNGQDAVGIAVTQLSTANALDVDRRAIAELDRLSKSFPPGMHYKLAFDTTDAVSESIRDVLFTVGSAILLVILVIFIFLGDWRTTMIHFIATPVSLIGTFVFVKLLGFSINTLTLFGITLATGLVVDDAIVVIENIERHIAGGRARLAQSGGGGHRGDYQRRHRHLAGAGCGVCAGCVLSRNDRHSVSAVCADHRIFDRHLGLQRADPGASAGGDFSCADPTERSGGGCESSTQGVRSMTRGYRALLHHLLEYKVAMAVLFFAGLGLTYFVFTRVPTGFVPDEDQGYFIIVIQAPSGASLEYTKGDWKAK